MNIITFYDLLGIDPSAQDRDTQAAALWPTDVINATEGVNVTVGSDSDALNIVTMLQKVATFDRVRAGADASVGLGDPARMGQITLVADMHLGSTALSVPTLYPRKLPNVGIQLLPTGTGNPATVFFASDARGHEVLVEGLSVELQLPGGLIEPLKDGVSQDGNPLEFDANREDSQAVVKFTDPDRTVVRTHVTIHLTPAGDVILEPSVPISIDQAKLSGLPAEAIHDLLLIPSPNRRDYFEWARNDLGSFIDKPPAPGALGFRAISLNFERPPLKDLAERFRDDDSGVHSESIDLVLDDVVIPVTGPVQFPVPSHGTFGLRRKITDRTSVSQAYSLHNAPFRLRLYRRDVGTNEGLYLFIDQLQFKTGSTKADVDEAPVVKFNAGIVWQGEQGSTTGGTVGIGDDWLLQAGFTLGDKSPLKLTIAGVAISLHALRGGLRLRHIGGGKAAWQLLGDLSIKDADAKVGGGTPAFKITTLTGKPLDVILRDVGVSFGKSSFSIAAPDGVQLIFAGFLRLIIEELGWVEEPGGGTYFSFSGGVALGFGGGEEQRPTSLRQDWGGDAPQNNGTGIRFRRLRFLTSSTPGAPPFKLDGIFLMLSYPPITIEGFGYISDDVLSGYRYQEWGFGVKLGCPFIGADLSLAAEFLKGSRRSITNPADGFTYFLASLQVGYIPAGAVELRSVRLLFAYNMQPALDPPGDGGQSMALYQWHREHDAAINMPRSRNLADWKPLDHSFAAGVGIGFSLNACGGLFHIGAFVLLAHSEEDTMILAVGDAYILQNPDPVAFVAIEYDFKKEKFGVMAGVDLTIDKFVGTGHLIPHWMSNIARLSGTIYFGNEPWSLAIGQLADQRSWLGVTVDVPLLELKLRAALGLEFTDGGAKGLGFIFSFAGGENWGIGAFIVFGSLGVIVGTWKTGSDSSGIEMWFQIGFKMHVFYVFHFGADIKVDLKLLGKRPWYTTLSAQIHIDTPWFLPDVTFKFERTWGKALPFDTATVNQALSSGSAASPKAPGNDSHATLHVPPLADGNIDPKRLYTFNELNSTSGAALEDVHARTDLPIVAVDADVSIEFTNPVANDATIATDTFTATGGDLGVQQVQDMIVRYALKSVSVKRSPRFGSDAGKWTDLVAELDTKLDLASGGSVKARPAVSFRWDADSRADGVLSPKRLLINSRTPYSLTVGSARNDEEAVANDPGFPCCHASQIRAPAFRFHEIDFGKLKAGSRVPAQQRFSDGGEWWHWNAPPATINGIGPYPAGAVVALVEARSGPVGSAHFGTEAYEVTASVDVSLLSGEVTLEGYRGSKLLASESLNASSGLSDISLRAKIDAGFTRVVLRCQPGKSPNPLLLTPSALGPFGALFDAAELMSIAYLTCDDARVAVGRFARCRSGDDLAPAVGGGGKLAFLPNYDYAVTATVEVKLQHKTGGNKTLTIKQPAYFRTRGLLGLNAVENVGDELRPYIASGYPAAGMPLYREEPVALAFTEDMSNLLPVDRVPAPGDLPEKAQLMELTLSIERLASTEGAQRLTVPSDDWLDAHDGVLVKHMRPPLHSGPSVVTVVSRSPSTDKRVRRFERVLDAGNCKHDALHSGQVLLHEPIGPDGTPGLWEPQAGLRATVRAKDGPYTERRAFKLVDIVAFEYLADAGEPVDWSWDDGSVSGPAAGRQYASLGEATWNHLQISTRIEPAGSRAGVAVGLAGSTPVKQALMALIEGGSLVIIARVGGSDHELARAPLPALQGPIELHVTAFDDRVRAQVGEVTLEADRGAIREGRIALVTDGAARFDSLLVDALDMYKLDFPTSRYASFADHIASHEPTVAAQQAGAMGAPPSMTPAQALAAHNAEIAGAMKVSAEPQTRQSLFDAILSSVGLPQLARCDRLTFTRLADTTGTTALLLESPEPISFLHDVSLRLWHRIWRRVPWWDGTLELDARIHTALPNLRFDAGSALGAPHLAAVLSSDGSEIAHVSTENPLNIDIYRGAVAGGQDRVAATLSASLDAAASRLAGLDDLADKPAGTIAALRPDRSIAGATIASWIHDSWVHEDHPVSFTTLTTGDETAALLIPAAPLDAGTYVFEFSLARARWTTKTSDPEATYKQNAWAQLNW